MKSVYTGGEKVAEFESYDELRVGDGKPAFIYEGDELVYPNPVKDGLVLWYDFSGRTNADSQRGIAEDLSGNGNHGTLQNFNYTSESGYDKNKLLFDGVDDRINAGNSPSVNLTDGITLEIIVNFSTVSESADVISKGSSTFGGNQNYFISMYNGGTLYFEVNNDGVRYAVTTKEVVSGENVLIQSVFGVNGLELYVNGNLVSSRNDRLFKGMVTNNNDLLIGGARNFEGIIYSTRIYNRPLTLEEITHNYVIEKERFDIE